MFNHHDYLWRFLPHKELNQIYISLALRSFGLSLVALFIPIYLHVDQGYSFQQTLGFYLFYSIVFAISTPLAAKFASIYGVKHTVIFSMPFYIVFILVLYFLPSIQISLLIPATLAGISLGFYWIGMHLLFHHASNHKHRGEEFGKRRAFMVMGGLLGPLIGGTLISFFGFQLVFCLASVILLVSGIILFLSKENHIGYNFSVRSIVNKDHWKNSLFFVSRGSGVIANGVIWPLFIFVILGSYLSLGVVGSILSGISAVLVWIVGKYSDHTDKRKIIRWITGFESLSWFLRALVKTVGHVFGATIFGAITSGIWTSPIGALEYDKAKGDVAGYFVSREIFLCLGRILILSVVIMTGSLKGGLVLQGFLNFASLIF